MGRFPQHVRNEIQADNERFASCHKYVRDNAAGEVEGVYGPSSMAWRLVREPVLLGGTLRAILLQLAHPAVAAGVHEHSSYREDPISRARRTLSMMNRLTFGDLETATGAARALQQLHHRVRGIVDETATGPWAGKPYRANHPELLLWVLATLVDSTLTVTETLLGSLSQAERNQYYAESRLSAALMGIPPDLYPPTLDDFYRYYNRMLVSDEVTVSEAGRKEGQALLRSPYLMPGTRTLTAALLPTRYRKPFGLRWNRRREKKYDRLVSTIRLSTRMVPSHLRAMPAYHQAMFRIAQARGERPTRLAEAHNWLVNTTGIPLGL